MSDPGDFTPRGEMPPGLARDFAQRVLGEVTKRMKTADTRLRCLGLAIELNAGTGSPPWFVIQQAEVLMAYYITGEKPPRPEVGVDSVEIPRENGT